MEGQGYYAPGRPADDLSHVNRKGRLMTGTVGDLLGSTTIVEDGAAWTAATLGRIALRGRGTKLAGTTSRRPAMSRCSRSSTLLHNTPRSIRLRTPVSSINPSVVTIPPSVATIPRDHRAENFGRAL
jgi:hypothetical protein